MTQNISVSQTAPVLAFAKFAGTTERNQAEAEIAIQSWRDQIDAAGLHAPDSVYEQLLAETPDRDHPLCREQAAYLKGILGGRVFRAVEMTGDEMVEFG